MSRYGPNVRSLLTGIGVIALFLFAGWVSVGVGPIIALGLASVVLVVVLLAITWRRRRRVRQ